MKNIDVTCAVIVRDESVLITQRGAGMDRSGKWEFPGGKLEKNETAEQCIIREIKEELDIDIKVIRWLEPVKYSYPDITIRLIPCLAKIISRKITAHEHSDYKWVSKNELMSFDWAPADIPVAKQVLNMEL